MYLGQFDQRYHLKKKVHKKQMEQKKETESTLAPQPTTRSQNEKGEYAKRCVIIFLKLFRLCKKKK